MTVAIFVQALLLGIPVGLALGLVGGGGSILTVPILIGVMGLEPKAATSASLVIVAVNAMAALRVYVREQLVQFRMAFTVTAAGLIGSIAGTWANHLISPQILTFAFTGLMVFIATKMLMSTSDETGSTQRASISRIVLAGTLIGLTTGFFGVGGGFIIVPALLALGLNMRQAVPTSLLVIALNSVVALGLRLIGGTNLPFAYALPMILGGVIGSSLAVRIAPKIGNLGLRRAFAALILLLAAYLGMTAFAR